VNRKPINRKCYGSIGHLPCSRLGPGDHKITDGQSRIATKVARDKHDKVIVTEKLDGSNVGVALKEGTIYPLTRAGYIANTSPFKMHHIFYNWVFENENRFRNVLNEGERICGEWLIQAHGTKYCLPHEPFVVFDIFDSSNHRLPYEELVIRSLFVLPHLISSGKPCSVEKAMNHLGKLGFHGAKEQVEGAVWRVERKGMVDYLCKYVRPDKIDGIYLNESQPVMNTWIGPEAIVL
jgi:ATP-dependent RNA circularization protein (DNA/RNA ligase family)